jgi:hypothetical protein
MSSVIVQAIYRGVDNYRGVDSSGGRSQWLSDIAMDPASKY